MHSVNAPHTSLFNIAGNLIIGAPNSQSTLHGEHSVDGTLLRTASSAPVTAGHVPLCGPTPTSSFDGITFDSISSGSSLSSSSLSE